MNTRRISVILTVKNDAAGCAEVLGALTAQTRAPDEIVVADGGSTDATMPTLRAVAEQTSLLRIVDATGANIARGRNLAAVASSGEILAFTDAGCRPAANWIEELVRPLEGPDAVDFVAGFYRVVGRTLWEKVVGLATMRGQLEPVRPETFNPSARSMACTREHWLRLGGFPEWLGYSEDTLFDHKARASGGRWAFAPDAVVEWRPRRTVGALARQFYRYGTGRGHTQIGASDFAYNLRNLGIVLAIVVLTPVTAWAAILLAAAVLYFYVWTFHPRAVRVSRATRRSVAYPLCLLVMWVVLFSNLAGYLVGSWQRWRDAERYRGGMREYLGMSVA